MNALRQLIARIARHAPIPAHAFLTRFVVCIATPPPPPPCKFEIIFAPRRIGILAGFALAVLAAPDAQAQTCSSGQFAYVNNACVDVQSGCETVDSAVNPIGGRYDSDASRCYLDTDGFHTITDNVAPYCRTDLVPANTSGCILYLAALREAGCNPPATKYKAGYGSFIPAAYHDLSDYTCVCGFGPDAGEPPDANGECAAVECTAPAVLNAVGNLCDCPAPNVGTDGADAPGDCVAPSVGSCGGLTPPQFYSATLSACVPIAVCTAPAVLNAGTNLCDCPAPNAGTDGAAAPGDCAAPSVGSCGGLTPAQFYSATLSVCVPFVECTAPAALNTGTNLCDCRAPNIGTDGAAAPGDCVAASAGVCGGLTPPQFYDSALGACVAIANCLAPSVLNAGANLCDCPSPNVGTDGAAAPGDCAVPAPSVEVCGGLTPAQFYDSAAGECVAIAECTAPAVLNAGANLCDCPAPNVGTDGAAAPGTCAVPSTEVCRVLTPSQFYDSAAGECVAFVECTTPSVLDAGANLCDCPAPNIGTDDAAAPGDCAAPSAPVCGGLTPAQFYDSAAGECVAFADCQTGATLNRAANQCECAGAAVLDSAGTGCLCESPNVGTPGDCVAPGAVVCEGLTPAQFYDSAAGACVPFVDCTAPAALNTGANLCDCPAPNIGTDGAAAPGDCVAPSAQVCGGLTPAKFYDSAAGACVAIADCLAPSVLDAGANLCDCPSPNVGTDGAAAPGDCAVPAPSAGVCGGLIPPQFYSATLSACVPFANCQGGATLNAGTNRCACPAGAVRRGGLCTPESDDFGELSDELLCGAFGGTVRMATGGGKVCSGMDANDTFCIMNSDEGFPCRGLFKHLRICNLTHNRPALNPFFCGAACGEMEAFGSRCR